jgi:type IV secretory pathway VirB10-like protein
MNGGESSPVVDPTWYLKHSNGIETDETATASPSAQPDNTPSPLPAPGAAAPSASLPAWVTSGPSGSYSVPAINPGALNGQGVPRKAVHYLDDNGSTAATGAAQPYEGGNAPQPDAGAGGGSPTDIVSAAAYAQQQGEAPPGTVAPAGGQENRSSQDYLDTENEAPRTAYELQAGGVIPAVLAGGINSDFCGNAQAVVSEDVYDSVYQHYLLVPAGSRLTGQCKSGSVYGQNRIFVVWNRLFFPNGHFRDLDGMDSQDQQGMTGINAHVDAHRGNTLGAIALLSVLQGGLAYLSNPMGGGNSSNGGTTVVIEGGGGGQSPAQAVAQSAATQISQLATTMTQQALSQAPTLQVQPGSRFNIAIERDIVFQEPFHR